jgi:hypothetical protein
MPTGAAEAYRAADAYRAAEAYGRGGWRAACRAGGWYLLRAGAQGETAS